jgi:zinc transport system substrate-binding protein
VLMSMRLAVVISVSASILAGFSNHPRAEENSPSERTLVTIYTVNYPLKYFADRIGGQHVNVVFPAPAGEDPAFWRPDAETVAAYQQADLILLNGANYAKWVSLVTLPASKMVNTTKSIKDRYISIENAVTHSHGPGTEHAHDGTAFTTWLDPEIAIAQASSIHGRLAELRPAHQAEFDRNFETLKSDLQALDERLKQATSEASGQPIVFSHPVFQYLQRRYQIDGKSVHWEPDTLPSGHAWAALTKLVESHSAKWMIWEDEPLDESVNQLSQFGLQSAVFDPCGNTPAEGDWLEVMNRNSDELARVFSAQREQTQ